MAGAGAVYTRAAPSQSLELQAARSALSAAHTAVARRRGGAVILRNDLPLSEREAIQRLVEDFT
jgi:hypothetical protein